jgi:hypothetical protein
VSDSFRANSKATPGAPIEKGLNISSADSAQTFFHVYGPVSPALQLNPSIDLK